ncbi:hypothetical protein [Streptomyces malaysiensis]|uniref:hypothetical protein n=1 Tax=Streptomyces malaysiensis TaxID=92644 RepID=UPI0036934D6A
MADVRVAFTTEVSFVELAEYAHGQGWRPETRSGYPIPATDSLEADAYAFVWRFDNGTARFVDDQVTEVQFIEFGGMGGRAAADTLSESFSTATYIDCLNWLDGSISDDEREKALEMLGVIAPREYESSVYQHISGGLVSNSVTIRAAAISAILQLSWAEFRSPLRRIAEADADLNNRAYASNVLHALPRA